MGRPVPQDAAARSRADHVAIVVERHDGFGSREIHPGIGGEQFWRDIQLARLPRLRRKGAITGTGNRGDHRPRTSGNPIDRMSGLLNFARLLGRARGTSTRASHITAAIKARREGAATSQ